MDEIIHNSIKFKQIKDFPNYYVSKCGKVYSKYSDKILRLSVSRGDYLKVMLYLNKERHMKSIHRLVAINFIPNPNNFPIVEHKDDNPSNNHVDNLEWSTQSNNIQNAFKRGLKKSPKANLGKLRCRS